MRHFPHRLFNCCGMKAKTSILYDRQIFKAIWVDVCSIKTKITEGEQKCRGGSMGVRFVRATSDKVVKRDGSVWRTRRKCCEKMAKIGFQWGPVAVEVRRTHASKVGKRRTRRTTQSVPYFTLTDAPAEITTLFRLKKPHVVHRCFPFNHLSWNVNNSFLLSASPRYDTMHAWKGWDGHITKTRRLVPNVVRNSYY